MSRAATEAAPPPSRRRGPGGVPSWGALVPAAASCRVPSRPVTSRRVPSRPVASTVASRRAPSRPAESPVDTRSHRQHDGSGPAVMFSRVLVAAAVFPQAPHVPSRPVGRVPSCPSRPRSTHGATGRDTTDPGRPSCPDERSSPPPRPGTSRPVPSCPAASRLVPSRPVASRPVPSRPRSTHRATRRDGTAPVMRPCRCGTGRHSMLGDRCHWSSPSSEIRWLLNWLAGSSHQGFIFLQNSCVKPFTLRATLGGHRGALGPF